MGVSPHDSAPAAAKVTKKVGLLFVHGIGEQKRWEFLTGTAGQFAELMRQAGGASVSVIDRTKDWKHEPGEPDTTSGAPVSLHVTSANSDTEANCDTDFECHEVWWADLGSRSGLGDVITFWIWGLGQWCAPIYRELDAAQLGKDERNDFNKPVPKIAKLPTSVAGTGLEPFVRLELWLAAIAAAAVAVTWGLGKRLLGALLGQAPSPTIIVQYVGDVRTYEERAAPGDTALSDPGFPRRVGIRRRMVTEMVAMADRGYDEWYVVAHSLGSVLAYNGLTEIGHTLPNYLPEQQWQALSGQFKSDPDCELRKAEEMGAMMPARPAWLAYTDVINRPLLFEKLKGFLTYGSPLNKFAALWPRVVATATDRKHKTSRHPFANDCQWINLVAPSDPVAGVLNRFSNKAATATEPASLFAGAIPTVTNIATPWSWAYVLAHIQYFKGVEAFKDDPGAGQKRGVMGWLMALPNFPITPVTRSRLGIVFGSWLAYPALVAVLLLLLVLAVTFGGGLALGLFGATDLKKVSGLPAFVASVCANLEPVIALILWVILLAGQWRWFAESNLNIKFAQKDAEADRVRFGAPPQYNVWPALIGMLRSHRLAASVIAALSGGVAITAFWLGRHFPLASIVIALISFAVSIIVQTLINRRVDPLKHHTPGAAPAQWAPAQGAPAKGSPATTLA